MKCAFCNRTLFEVGHLTRINPKGPPGIWACPDDAKPSPQLAAFFRKMGWRK